MVEFAILCRLCVGNENISSSLNNLDADNVLLIDKLKAVIPGIGYNNGELPNVICTLCIEQLSNAYRFIQKCLKSDVTLKHYLHQLKYTGNKSKNNDKKTQEKIFVKRESDVNKPYKNDLNEQVDDSLLISKYDEIQYTPELVTVDRCSKKDNNRAEKCLNENSKNIFTDTDVNESLKENSDSTNLLEREKCERTFINSANFKMHLRKHKIKKQINYNSKKIIKKPITRLNNHKITKFFTKTIDSENVNKCSTNLNTEVDALLIQNDKPIIEENHENIYNCEVCGESFNNLTNFRPHIRKHKSKKPFSESFPLDVIDSSSNLNTEANELLLQKHTDPVKKEDELMLQEDALSQEENEIFLIENEVLLIEDESFLQEDPLLQEDKTLLQKDELLLQKKQSLLHDCVTAKDGSMFQQDKSFMFEDESLLQENKLLLQESLLQKHGSLLQEKQSLLQDCVTAKDGSMQQDKSFMFEDESLLQENKLLLQESLLQKHGSLLQEHESLLQESESMPQEDESLVQGDKSLLQEDELLLQENESLLQEDRSLLQVDNNPTYLTDKSEIREARKPYNKRCEICGKFIGKSGGHVCAIEEEPHKCKICNRLFKTSNNMKKHLQLHLKKKENAKNYKHKIYRKILSPKRRNKYKQTKEKTNKLNQAKLKNIEIVPAKTESSKHEKEVMETSGSLLVSSEKEINNRVRKVLNETSKNSSTNVDVDDFLEDDSDSTNVLECEKCERTFVNSANFKTHLRMHKNKKPITKDTKTNFPHPTTEINKSLRNDNKKNKSSYKCELCKKDFQNIKTLKAHTYSHKYKTEKKCPVCGKLVIHLKIHMWSHSKEKQYVCVCCEQSYYRHSALLVHIRAKHENDWPYQCKGCNKHFIRNDAFKKHMKNHAKEQNEKKKLQYNSVKTNLKRRKKRRGTAHTNLRPYKCNICNARFTRDSHLKRHLKGCAFKKKKGNDNLSTVEGSSKQTTTVNTFTVENSHEDNGNSFVDLNTEINEPLSRDSDADDLTCDLCDKYFTNAEKLKQHTLIHKRKLQKKCKICGKLVVKLNAHMRIHTKEMPYKCLRCGLKFRYSSSLRRHVQKRHEFNQHLTQNEDRIFESNVLFFDGNMELINPSTVSPPYP